MRNEHQAKTAKPESAKRSRTGHGSGARHGRNGSHRLCEIAALESRVMLAGDVIYYPLTKTFGSIQNYPRQNVSVPLAGVAAPQGLTPANVRGAYAINNIAFGNV